jgi:glycosyltransferase involved in cell wall biosynthesis
LNFLASRSVQQISPLSRKDTDLTATVIICTRNRVALLRKCLEALTVLEPPADEILVVDNSAGDRDTELVAREFAVRYIVEPTPGLSRARNRGFAESHTDIVAYLDDDAVPDKSWLRFILDPFRDARVAVVSGDTLCPE